jgi:chaperonin GroES
MKFKPAQGYIAVQVETMQKSQSGIYIPTEALLDRLSRGKVVGTSNVRLPLTGELLEPDFKLDESVLFVKGTGYPFKVDGIELILLKNEEILGTVEE